MGTLGYVIYYAAILQPYYNMIYILLIDLVRRHQD